MKFKSIFLLVGLVFGVLSATDCSAQKTGAKDRVNTPVNLALKAKPQYANSGPVIGDPNTNESYKSPNLDYIQTSKKADLCNSKYGSSSIRKNSDHIRFFQIKNIGTEPLKITDAKTTCGCVKVKFSTVAIQPGETASIEVDYDTTRIGPFQKAITLETNAQGSSFRFLISGEVSDCQ